MNDETQSNSVEPYDLTQERCGTVPVTIKTGDYTGQFRVDETGPYSCPKVGGEVVVYLSPGRGHQISTGNYFFFDVLKDGEVANITNGVAAEASGDTLTFHSVSIKIDPGSYGCKGGGCKLTSYPKKLITDNPESFTVIAGMRYALDTGAAIGPTQDGKHYGSYVWFDVRGDGTIWSRWYAAAGLGSTLHLNTGVARMTPPHGELRYRIGNNDKHCEHTGPADVPVIFGLRTCIIVLPQTVGGHNYVQGVAYISPEYTPESATQSFCAGNAWFDWEIPRDLPANR